MGETESTGGPKRRNLSKRIRFEVFKRDSFTCQYCGRKAPEVVLHVDHIEPVACGGDDSALNLTTACFDCNAGKGKRALSDDSIVAKQRRQLDELQERQEQIRMMIDWQRSLVDIETEAVKEAASFWCSLADWHGITDEGHAHLRKLLRKYELARVLDAMRTATEYFKHDDDGNLTSDSTNLGFDKIGGILRIQEAEKEKPWLRDLFYTRGIVRKRLSFVRDHVAKEILEAAYEAGIPTDVSRPVALHARSWTAWQNEMWELINSWPTPPAEE